MTIKKIEIRPNENDYADILYPKTSADMVMTNNGKSVEETIKKKAEKDHKHAGYDIQLEDGTNLENFTSVASTQLYKWANFYKAHNNFVDSPVVNVPLGYRASADGRFNVAIGCDAKTNDNFNSIAIGRNAAVSKLGDGRNNLSSIAIGEDSYAEGLTSIALGCEAEVLNHLEGVLGSKDNIVEWTVPCNFTVNGTKNFEISHPKPSKKATHRIRHAAVESPTAGDTLYRWKIKSKRSNDLVIIDLPDYFIYLNKNVQIFVTPQGHFGNGYGELNRKNEQLEIHCQHEGEYNVLAIGTRNDDHPGVQNWDIKGVEKEVGESWMGETYIFKVDEITEVEEITEEVVYNEYND